MIAILKKVPIHLQLILILLTHVPMSRAASYEQPEEIKLLASDYSKHHKSTDAYLMDLLVNRNHHGSSEAKKRDSGIYYFYEAKIYLDEFRDKEIKSLDKALKSIDMAIQKDPIALNYFYKSYLLNENGNKVKSDNVFIEGINKPFECKYLLRGSKVFVKMIDESGNANEVAIFWFMSSIIKLRIDNDFHQFMMSKLEKYIATPSLSTEYRHAITCGVISFININSKSFYMLQENIIRNTNALISSLPEDYVPERCYLNYDPEALNEPENYLRFARYYQETNETELLKNSIIWRNFQSIVQVLKSRK